MGSGLTCAFIPESGYALSRYLTLLFFSSFYLPSLSVSSVLGTYTLSRLDIGAPSPFHVHSFPRMKYRFHLDSEAPIA